MHMGFRPLNPQGGDGPTATWLERLAPLDMNTWEGSADVERVSDGYAHCARCGTVSGNGCEGWYVFIKVGLTVWELTSGISSLPSSDVRENSSSSYDAGVDVALDCSE